MEMKANCNHHICTCYDIRLANAEVENSSLKMQLMLLYKLIDQTENILRLYAAHFYRDENIDLLLDEIKSVRNMIGAL